MALPKLFNLITWHNNTTPAINEDNLNAMSQAIDDIDDRVIGLAGTIMEDVPQIQEDLEILEPAIENIDSNVERAETAADDAEDSAETAEYWANVSNPPIPVVKDFANVITVDDAIPKAATDVKVKIEAVQDLHGYTKPWVGGAGKNKLSINTISLNRDTKRTLSADIAPIPAGSYKLSWNYSGTAQNVSFILRKAPNVETDQKQVGVVGATEATITLTETYSAIYAFIGNSEASGTTANISNLMLEVGTTKTAFEPYENICPISGFTEVKLPRTGKNLFKTTATTSSGQGVTWTVNDDGTITPSGTASGYAHISAGEALVKSSFGKVTVSGLSGATNIVYDLIRVMDKDNNELANFGNSVSTNVTIDLSNYPKAQKIFVELKRASNAAVGGIIKPQIELGDTDTPYASYNGTDYIIDLDGTRYGATLDVTSGVMTVTHGFNTFDNTDDWKASGAGGNRYYLSLNNTTFPYKLAENVSAISNKYEYLGTKNGPAALSQNGFALWYNSSSPTTSDREIYIKDDTAADVATLKTHLASTPLTVKYELATPITVQLTPKEVQMLQGYNVLSANSGDVYLEYDASMIQRIANEKLDISTFKSVVASSSDFADFKTKVAAL